MGDVATGTHLPAAWPLVGRHAAYHARLLVRSPRALFGGVLLPVLLLVMREANARPGSVRTSGLIVGLAVMGAISTAYVTHTSALVAARERGVLKRWRATPLPSWAFFVGRIAATVVLAVVSGAATLLVGTLFYDLRPSASGVVGLLVSLTLGATAWASVGTAFSALLPSVESAWPLLGATYIPVILLSGAFGSLQLPRWLATIQRNLPAAPIIDAANRALHDGKCRALPVTAHDALVLVAWAAAGLLISVRTFEWEPGRSGRRRSG
jgi:ABC-2 type transport system permease protein